MAVYRFSLDQPDDVVSVMVDLLTADEVDRADRFAFRHLRNRYIAGRAGLRVALGSMLDTPPRNVRIAYGPNGKPALGEKGNPVKFNLSHSDDLALLVATVAGEVGIDIEKINPALDLDEISGRFFSRREQDEYMSYAPADRAGAFFRCWTRKEAVIKAMGDGLSFPLDQFDVSLEERNARLLTLLGCGDPAGWSMFDLRPHREFAAAVVVRGRVDRLEAWNWNPLDSPIRPAILLR